MRIVFFSRRFFIDLRSGFDFTIDAHDDTEDDILFHMSVWPCDDEVVRNHFDENGWGEEEKSGVCPIKYNQSFNMIILVDTDHFKVSEIQMVLIVGAQSTSAPHHCSRTPLPLSGLYTNSHGHSYCKKKMILFFLYSLCQVALNGVHFCEFRYRKPISLAKFLYINGAVKIQAIEFRGGNQPAVGFR